MDDQLQLDRQLVEFFQEAQSVSLSPAEKETMRYAMETFLMEKSVIASPASRLQEYMAHGREASGGAHYLGDKEKRQLRKNIVSFMQQNPRVVPEEAMEEAVGTFSLFRLFEIAVPRLALGLMLFVGLGAGVSFASQSAIPGDFLYGFKVKVYEPIVSTLSTSDEAQAKWEAKRVENRLKEMEQLSVSANRTEQNAAELRVRFNDHLEAAQKNIESLNAKGEADVALTIQTGIETSLDSHSSALRDIALESDHDASVGAAVSVMAKQQRGGGQDHSKPSVPPGLSLKEKVQTILSLPALVPASSSSSAQPGTASSSSEGFVSSSSVRSDSTSSAASSKSKKNDKPSSSSIGAAVSSSVHSSAAPQTESSSSLVPQLFDDIMDAASSTMSLSDLLPKL